jgi:AAA15 family ATPase/GTPase
MLIQFSVKNWRSIRDEQAINMTMGVGDEMIACNTFQPDTLGVNKLLRTAVIYGANSAGKSNFLNAITTMKSIVVKSASKGQRGDDLPVVPFLLDEETEHAPTEFEVIFITDSVRYQYGFSCTNEKIIQEWLLTYPKGRPRKWFVREWNEKKNDYDWDTGNSLTGQKQLWQDATRQNALFLSTAVQLNSQQLQPVYDWFLNTLRLTNVSGWSSSYTASLCKGDNNERKKILKFLKAADFDIHDLIIESEKLTAKHLPDDMPDGMKSELLNDLKDQEIFNIKTLHQSKQGKSVSFDFDDESDGTQKFFAFAGPWLDCLKNGFILVIDELHDNLHPSMVKFLVSLFHSNETNPKNAQLIFTTHETSILNQEVFRRDQVWFCKKNADQSTKIYPLTDFSPRKGRENLEANYLAGRYEALPYFREIDFLFSEDKNE